MILIRNRVFDDKSKLVLVFFDQSLILIDGFIDGVHDLIGRVVGVVAHIIRLGLAHRYLTEWKSAESNPAIESIRLELFLHWEGRLVRDEAGARVVGIILMGVFQDQGRVVLLIG